jgi:ethanolamine utilization protein EutA
MTDEAEGGRIFFSNAGRTLDNDEQICVLSVGVDIGSSTSHLVFSRIVLERLDSRYIVTERETFYQSDILLTPYKGTEEIDSAALGEFIAQQYKDANVDPNDIDTGALILTGVAVRRRNARGIGEIFAAQAGKLVAVSAGDSLETVMAAYGSGAAARSEKGVTVMNVDIGGGTSKISICADGKAIDHTAVDVGARLICVDGDRKIVRLEEAGRRFGKELGLDLALGTTLSEDQAKSLATKMAECLFETLNAGSPKADGAALLRLHPLTYKGKIDEVTFSGGVSEYIYSRETETYGDLGPLLGAEVRARAEKWGPRIEEPIQGIRATVIGASQYTTQVSGSTIFVHPLSVLPIRNIPVIAPNLELEGEVIDPAQVSSAIKAVLTRLELDNGRSPVAVFVPWGGSATFQRLDAFCHGVVDGLSSIVAKGHPIVLAGDGDVGGLVGIHLKEEMKIANAIVSIDGLELKDFDYIDVGAMLDTSGAVPVVIKSLIFPSSANLGQDWENTAKAGEPAPV